MPTSAIGSPTTVMPPAKVGRPSQTTGKHLRAFPSLASGQVPLTRGETILYRSPVGVLEIQLKDSCVYSVAPLLCSSPVTGHSITPGRKKPFCCSPPVVDFLNSYFAGDRAGLRASPPLFLRGTVFQQKVWAYLQTIPYGQTQSYTEVAQAVGSPRAVRAVGSACGKNPYLILVPCHRVVAKKGLGGFALGLAKKRQLLNHEQGKRLSLTSTFYLLSKKEVKCKSFQK